MHRTNLRLNARGPSGSAGFADRFAVILNHERLICSQSENPHVVVRNALSALTLTVANLAGST